MIRLSKEISYLLRHTPLAQSDPHGWVDIPELQDRLRHPATYDEIKHVVQTNNKVQQRFVLDEASIPPRIRAAQGHTVTLEQPILEPVSNADDVPVAIHITSEDGWNAIQSSGYLRKMSRTHIHFATSSKHLRRNVWATVLLKLDLHGVLAEQIPFFLSSNQVLLTEVNIPCKFLTKVTQNDLPTGW